LPFGLTASAVTPKANGYSASTDAPTVSITATPSVIDDVVVTYARSPVAATANGSPGARTRAVTAVASASRTETARTPRCVATTAPLSGSTVRSPMGRPIVTDPMTERS
jgi:hypothetical protein